MNVKNRWGRIGLVFALTAVTVDSGAAPLYCQGTIQKMLMYSGGEVMMFGSWRGDWTTICKTDGSIGGVPTEVCLSWYAAALSARINAKPVTVYYADAAAATCATLPTYTSAPTMGYFMIDGP